MNNQEKMRDVRCEMRPGRGSSLQRCTACTACIRLHISRCTVVYDALQCIHIPRFFLCFKMRERFFIPDTVLVQFCLPSTATHGCIIVAVATNCTPVIPSTLASPLSPQSPLPSLSPVSSLSMLSHIILQHSEPCHTLCPIQSYHCHTCHFYHPLKTLPTLLHLPSIINFPFATDFEYYSSDAERRVGHEGALVEKRIVQPI